MAQIWQVSHISISFTYLICLPYDICVLRCIDKVGYEILFSMVIINQTVTGNCEQYGNCQLKHSLSAVLTDLHVTAYPSKSNMLVLAL